MLLIILSLPVYSQSVQIDSVIIHRCNGTGNSISKSIDSLDTYGNLRSTTYYYSDTAGAPNSKHLYTYSSSNKPLSDIYIYIFDSVTFQKELEKIWLYDASDSLTSYSSLSYSSNNTLPYYGSGDKYTYDNDHRIFEHIYLKFDRGSSTLVNDFKIIFSYDSLQRVHQKLSQTFNDTTGTWQNYSRETITYDSSGKIFKSQRESWVSPGMFNLYKTFFSYYLPNDSLEHTSIIPGFAADSFVTLYTYDTLGLIQSMMRGNWAGGMMVIPDQRFFYFYDSNNNLTSIQDDEWTNYGWQGCTSTTYTYDSLNRLLTYYYTNLGDCGRGGSSSYTVYDSNGIPDSSGQCSWTMGTINCGDCANEYYSIERIQNPALKNTLSIFPNPARLEISIASAALENGGTLFIYDSIGKLVRTEILKKEVTTLYISDLARGIYFISVPVISGKPQRFIKL